MIYDIKKAKELGFHLLRKHGKIESLRFYYHCDRLGMLVCQDMVNGGRNQSMFFTAYLPNGIPFIQDKISDVHYKLFGRKDKNGRREWLKECKATILLLDHHPSVIMWCPFNEGWGQFDSKKSLQTNPSKLILEGSLTMPADGMTKKLGISSVYTIISESFQWYMTQGPISYQNSADMPAISRNILTLRKYMVIKSTRTPKN